MDKFTIDIDKVLDEFEETEALKINAAPQLADCFKKQLASLENEGVTDIWPKTSPVEENDSSILDKKVVCKNIDKLKEDADLCSVQSNVSNLSIINDAEIHFDDANVKNFSFNIFYKSCESGPVLDVKNCNQQSESLNCISDEILCISVLENSSQQTASNSHTNISEAFTFKNVQSNDFVSSPKSETLNHLDTTSSVVSNDVFDTEKLKLNSEINYDKGIEKLSYSNCLPNICDSCKSEQVTQKTIKNLEIREDDSNRQSSEPLISQSSCCQSEPMNDNLVEACNMVHCEVKQSAFSKVPDNCSNQNVKVEVVSVNSHSQDVDNAKKCETGFNVHCLADQNGLNHDFIQDDDSGVSSTEDISGNSLSEVMNNKDCSVVNENCDIFNSMDKETSFDDCCTAVSVISETFVSNDSNFISELGIDMHKNVDPNVDVRAASLLRTVEQEILHTDNDNTSLGYFTKYNKNHINTSDIGTCSQEDFKPKEDVLEITLDMSSKNIKNGNSLNNYTREDSSSPVSEKIIHPSFTYSENLVAKAFENSFADLTIYEEKDIEYVENYVCKQNKVGEIETLNYVEVTTPFQEANDNISGPIQRPTTLDLPSMLISSDEPQAESQLNFDDNNEQLIDISTEVSVVEERDTEIIPGGNQLTRIGIVKPYWIPDAEASNCMQCGMKFTVLKRRHHCRGCGKVLCSRCCNQKAYLAYLNKEDRICQSCSDVLISVLQNDHISVPLDSQSSSSCGSSPSFSPSTLMSPSSYTDKNIWKPHPNNPDDYCSVIPPLQQIQISGPKPPPTVMVPTGVLKRGNKQRREPKQVIFSDGIRPGGDLTDIAEAVETGPVYHRIGRKRVDKIISAETHTGGDFNLSSEVAIPKGSAKRVIISDEEGTLPPILLQIDTEEDETVDWNQIFEKIHDVNLPPMNFALMKNLHLFVKIVNLDCCFGNECWYFTSHGLCTVGQDEVMVIMEKLQGENTLPRDILKLFRNIYDSAIKGTTFNDLSHIFFSEQILGSNDHRGFLFVRPTFQCLSKLIVPNTPYLVAILIHKWEVPWAKVFPLRLMLRLGAECRYYPCSLVSIRYRKPVYFEIGQTIMSVLSDLRNFQFTIPLIPGLVVHMEEKKTFVNIPRNRYEKLIKVLNSNNVEHVLALGANFSAKADSHLVCMQNEEGDYQTQAINIENTTRKVTGASFIVFSGALKSTSGLSAKFSIVEDGLLVQISQETMVALHMALRGMRDISIDCGQMNSAPEETVIVQWTRDDKKFNIGVRSPIDGRSLEGIPNLRIHTSTDYAGENYLIRWTEVFFFAVDHGNSAQNELVDPCRLAETVAQSCCMALAPYLDQLAEAELIKLGLRVTLDSQQDKVEYDIGACGKALPGFYMNSLDSGLIPVMLRLSSSTHNEKLSFELIFHVMIK